MQQNEKLLPNQRVINSGFLKLKQEGSDAAEATLEIHYNPPKKHDSFLVIGEYLKLKLA